MPFMSAGVRTGLFSPGAMASLVDLHFVGAVLRGVLLLTHCFGRQLPGFAHGNETGADGVGQRGREDEAARLDAQHLVDLHTGVTMFQRVDHNGETALES